MPRVQLYTTQGCCCQPHQVGQVSVGQDSPLDGYFATSFHSTLFGSESLSAAHTSGVGSYVLSLGAGE